MRSDLSAIPVESRAQEAWRLLRGAILSGRFPPGTPLRFQELQDFCGMSVSPVREALAQLVVEGLVRVEHNRGYRVVPLSLPELDDLVRSRIVAETWALRQSIERGDETWEAALLSAFHMLERVPRYLPEEPKSMNSAWSRRHGAFHAALIAGCGSEIFLQFIRHLYDRAELYRCLSMAMEDGPRDASAEHGAILEAALARRADEACALLARHYEATGLIIRDQLRSDEGAKPRG